MNQGVKENGSTLVSKFNVQRDACRVQNEKYHFKNMSYHNEL